MAITIHGEVGPAGTRLKSARLGEAMNTDVTAGDDRWVSVECFILGCPLFGKWRGVINFVI